MFLGIDFGAKKAGTTAICYLKANTLKITQSKKNEDADKFIELHILETNPSHIFIDAPLSLPNAYFGKGDDYFFRKSDREVNAMSPMFLGGLTARAMKLKKSYPNIQFYEAYPGLNAKMNFIEISSYYKNKSGVNAFVESFIEKLPYPVFKLPVNWHQVDSILAWLTGYRFFNNSATCFGDSEEGLIWV